MTDSGNRVSLFPVMSNISKQLEQSAREDKKELIRMSQELAAAKATIKKLQNQKQNLEYQVAWGLNEVKSLNKRLKEQSPLVDLDNMKKV